MISSNHMATALYGAYRLARTDTNGMSFFDDSLEGFWRSFFAAVLIAPLFLVLITLQYQARGSETPAAWFISVEVISYIIGWFAFPLVAFYLVQALGREKKYLGYIVAYNWGSVLQNLLYMPFAFLVTLGLVEGRGVNYINVILLLIVFTYTWFIAKTALDITSLAAIGIVVLDIVLWVMISSVSESMLRTVQG